MAFIFIYGRPGSGKTTLASSMTKLGYRVNIVDVDQKANKMENIKGCRDNGSIIVTPIEEKLSEVSMKEKILHPNIALAKQPKGYLAICEIIGTYETELAEGKSRKEEVLVLDSLTSFTEHLKRLISQIQKKPKFSFDEWNILLTNFEDFFYTMMRLCNLFVHVIIIAHEQVEKDEDTGRIQAILPAVEGSMRNKISKYFEEVYHTRIEVKNQKVSYLVETVPLGKAEARTSRSLEPIENADFTTLFKEEMK